MRLSSRVPMVCLAHARAPSSCTAQQSSPAICPRRLPPSVRRWCIAQLVCDRPASASALHGPLPRGTARLRLALDGFHLVCAAGALHSSPVTSASASALTEPLLRRTACLLSALDGHNLPARHRLALPPSTLPRPVTVRPGYGSLDSPLF